VLTSTPERKIYCRILTYLTPTPLHDDEIGLKLFGISVKSP
jgi:hypothetical protein